VHDGIRLYFSPLATSSKPLHVRLHETTAQDLTLDLGPPLRIHYKEDERMTIHSMESVEDDNDESDCKFPSIHRLKPNSGIKDFYNYFQHGLDFFISGSTHTVNKIVVHSNIASLFHSIEIINLIV
jgi:hypothetical protein